MKVVDITELSSREDVNIGSVFAINQYWKSGQSFIMKNPRPRSAFLWFYGCMGEFITTEGERIPVPLNSLVYIPEGTQYEIRFSNKSKEISTVLLSFNLYCEEKAILKDKICVISDDLADTRAIALINKMVFEYSMPSKPCLKLKRDLFGLLSLICESESLKSIKESRFAQIVFGIEYLQRNEEQSLSIDELAKACFVSPAYFRRLFKEYAGVSPSQYRTERRIERARELLAHTDLAVEAVGELLGYSDPSYFCRTFKKMTGESPSQYKKKTEDHYIVSN